MIAEAKNKNIYIDTTDEEEANKMYNQVAGSVISINKNKRCDSFCWYSHVRYIQKEKTS